MNVEYSFSKDGKRIFSINSVFFHSKYAPIKEAERQVQSQHFDFSPEFIVVLEPGFSYTLPFLKELFPTAKIGIVRFIPFFEEKNVWDFELDFNSDNLLSFFEDTIGETGLFSTSIISFLPSQTVFKEQISAVWRVFKESLDYAKTLLLTREVFEKKWLLNTVTFLSYAKKTKKIIAKTKLPVVVAASGPSLKAALPILKEYRNSFFLIGLSSSLSVLLSNNIEPDIALSSDGGYWAGAHLNPLFKSAASLAAPVEAFAQKKLLSDSTVIPLCYEDGLSSMLLSFCSLQFFTAKRNGTVSGTALCLAKELTDNAIFMLGLDLQGADGFQHTEPNALEQNSKAFDNRIRNIHTRQTRSRFMTSSLDVYRQWFSNLGDTKRIFRVIDKSLKNPQLGKITDISSLEFKKEIQKITPSLQKNTIFSETKHISKQENARIRKKIEQFIEDKAQTEEWKKSLFLTDSVLLSHAKNLEEKKLIQEKIDSKNRRLIERLRKTIDADNL